MTVGVLGGGQLGRMLALAGLPMGLRFRFLDPSAECCAAGVGDVVEGGFDDPRAVERFCGGLDLATYEFENVPLTTADAVQERLTLRPGARALAVAQDRLKEKRFFRRLGVATAPFEPIDEPAHAAVAADTVGFPAVLKTRRMGYDGKGQARVETLDELRAAVADLGGRDLILEAFVPFDRELSVIGVRSPDGHVAVYPLAQNTHSGGILRLSFAPAPDVGDRTLRAAADLVEAAMRALDYAGVLAVELFHAGDGLLVNEMAPRVHNSGHWTIDGAQTSQFENHLRAVLGWPLGPTGARAPSAMLNLIGDAPTAHEVLSVDARARVHLYGKGPRPGRKVGHVTLVDEDRGALGERVARLADALRLEGVGA